MTNAWYFVQNLAFKEVLNLLCYGVREPNALNDAQKYSRLYKYYIHTELFLGRHILKSSSILNTHPLSIISLMNLES